MTDLILNYGTYPRFLLKPHEVILFQNATLSPYFSIDNQGNFQIANSFFSAPLQDVYRYDLIFVNNNGVLVYPETYTPARGLRYQAHCQIHGQYRPIVPSNNNILIVLESPHKSEYCNDCFHPITPANGTTGRKIFTRFIAKALPSLITSLDTSERYSICIVNPVPFQTSLQFIHKQPNMPVRLRNNVWKELYTGGCENNFITRITGYSPHIIINACTHNLKDKVKNTLDANWPSIPIIRMSHPAAW